MFIVEDGTGLADANSYVTVLEYQGYCADRGIDVTSETDEQIQSYLVNATDYIDLMYDFKGEETTTTQSLKFPRTYDGVEYGVPTAIKYSVIELALAYRTNTNLYSSNLQGLKSKKEKVGPIETAFEYRQEYIQMFPKADNYLKGWKISLSFKGQLRTITG